MARALGEVYRSCLGSNGENFEEGEEPEENGRNAPLFVLELYPSHEQRVVAGRFLVELRQRRRAGAGSAPPEDRWLSESIVLPGDIVVPRLRWARKERGDPETPAHVAIANYLVLRLTEPDARALVRNVARSDQERVWVDQIKQMERFRALYFSEINTGPARIALKP